MPSRRDVLRSTGVLGGSCLLSGCVDIAYTPRFHLTPSGPVYAPDALQFVGAGGPNGSATERFTLRPGEYTVVLTERDEDESLRFRVTLTSGGPIDAILLPSEGSTHRRHIYRTTAEFPEPIISRQVTTGTTIGTDSPGLYQFVLDNSGYGETSPSGVVRGEVKYGYV